MKTSNLTFAGLAVFLSLMLSTCSDKEADNYKDKDIFEVSLAIIAPSPTKAVSDPIGDSDRVIDFTSGRLYFVSSSGLITKHMFIVEGNTLDEENIGIDKLKNSNPVIIPNVPGNSRILYIIGNIPASTNTQLTSSGSFNDIKSKTILIESQHKEGGTVENATIYGHGDIIKPQTDGDPATVTVKPIPLISRLEVGKFEQTGNVITSYQIDGIFMNNFYEQIAVDGTPRTADLVNYGPSNDTKTVYLPDTETNGQYPGKYKACLYDYSGTGIGVLDNLVYRPADNGKIWAYNIFATTVVPHIVIRFTNIITEPASGLIFPGVQYITVRTYTKNEQGIPVTLDRFEPGYIYAIKSFEFNETHLKDKAEEDDVPVAVYVELMQWKTEELTPGL